MRVLLPLLLLLLIAPSAFAGGPGEDPFYDAPDQLAANPNGTILKRRDVESPLLGVTAQQVQYRSTDARGAPIAVVSTLLIPLAPYAGTRPLVSYQVAYDSLANQCVPSATIADGTQPELPSVQPLLDAGYAVALPDYEGPTHAFTAGPLAGHTVLDGIRAAQALLSGRDTPTALFGYSGGGQATAWAAQLQPSYASGLTLAGVAAGGVAPDLEQLIRASDNTPLAGVGLLSLFGLERQFPEILLGPRLNAAGLTAREEAGGVCGPAFVRNHENDRLADKLNDPGLDFLALPRTQRVIQRNRLGAQAPAAPVYLFHTTTDQLVPVTGVDGLANRWCAGGASVLYQRDTIGDHLSYPAASTPGAYTWLRDRFDGAGLTPNCGTTPRGYIGRFCPRGHSTKFKLPRIDGRRIIRVVVRVGDVPYKRKTGPSLRRVIIRGLAPGRYEFTVTRFSPRDERTASYSRRIVCEE